VKSLGRKVQDGHQQAGVASAPKLSNQKPKIINNPSLSSKMNLLVAQPKAIKCSKVVISTPQPTSSEHFDTTSPPMVTTHGPLITISLLAEKMTKHLTSWWISIWLNFPFLIFSTLT
jgi:hypothetical protein